MNFRFRRLTAFRVLPVSFFSIAYAFGADVPFDPRQGVVDDLSAYGEPVVVSPPPGPTVASSAAAAGIGKVRGRIECQTANYCLFKGLALIGTIDDAMTKQLIGLFEDFDRRVDPKVQPEGFVHTEIRLNSVGGCVPPGMEVSTVCRKPQMTDVVSATFSLVSPA